MMRQWYLQGMGDANRQHQDLVRRVNLILDQKDTENVYAAVNFKITD